MTPKSSKTRFVYFIIFFLVFLAVAPFILLYSFGYNWTKNFSLLKTGGVYVYSSETGAQLYIDDTLDNSTSVFQHGLLVKDLRPDTYSVKLAKDGYIDWKKNIEVMAERVSEAYPFLIPKQIVTTVVPQQIPKSAIASSSLIANPEYKDLLSLFATTTKVSVPIKKVIVATSTKTTTTYPSIESKKLVIEKIGADLRATWNGSSQDTPFYFCIQNKDGCVSNFIVYSTQNIGTFNFYPSRNDVVLVVVNSKIMVVELDKRTPQNIVELYSSPTQDVLDFRVLDNETIVIKEGKKLIKLSLVYAKQ
ncbi:MAG: PEGA domain-containing protein [bacterium]